MLEVNFYRLLEYFKKRVYIIFIFAIIFGLIGGFFINYIYKPSYTTYATIVLKSSNNDNDIGEEVKLNQYLLPTYKEIFKSKKVLNNVIDKLSLNYSYVKLLSKIKISSSNDSEIIKISLYSSNKEEMIDIINEIISISKDVIKEVYHLDNIKIVEYANIIDIKYSSTLYLSFFILLGSVLGLIYIIISYFFYNKIKYKNDITKALDFPLLGSISKSTKADTIDQKDEIQSIRTNILFSSIDIKNKTILVTSSKENEGKSFISSQLAISFTELDYKVLIVDCDMRKGRLNDIFNIFNKKGLSNILFDSGIVLDDIVQKTKINNLDILTKGMNPPNPSELVSSNKFSILIEKLKNQYDFIIFDSPPINVVSDAMILSKKVDQSIIVCRNDFTNFHDLQTSIKNIKKSGNNLIGLIFNMADEIKNK